MIIWIPASIPSSGRTMSGNTRLHSRDPGEVGRACCIPENEIIFSVPYEKLEMLVEDCEAKQRHSAGRTFKHDGTIMPEFSRRPQFYNELFEMWGLVQHRARYPWTTKPREAMKILKGRLLMGEEIQKYQQAGAAFTGFCLELECPGPYGN